MICYPCRNSRHTGCRGGAACCCQHRTDRRVVRIDDVLGDTYAAPVTATGFDDTEEDNRG